MAKSIIKEIGIILLLIITILLVLGIMFYDYRPSTKKIPKEIEGYTLSQEMANELEETIKTAETQNIVKIYRVDSGDLKLSQRRDQYIPGKKNPFSKVAETISNTTGNGTTSGGNTTNSGSQGGRLFNEVK